MPFIHLHSHSHYSLLDGLPKIDDMINHAKELGMPALALTDHGVMYGALEFYQKAKKAGIKPIIGMEGYLAPGSRRDRKANEKPYHQILYAKNLEGYKNLMTLSSLAHLEGFYYKPRMDKEILEKYHKGIIATTSCLQGEVAQTIVNGNIDKAIEKIKEFQQIFGKDDFYLEVQSHPEIEDQVKLNKILLEIAKEYQIPTIATNDSHYLKKEDAQIQDILVCVQTGKTVQDANRLKMTGVDLSMKTEKEMREQFPENPEVIEETARLADKCDIEIELGDFHFPKFEPPQGLSADEHLKQLAYAGLKEKCEDPCPEGYQKRVDYELEVIQKKDYATYFLIFADFSNWSRENGIIATVRGSAAGSLVSYVTGITSVDPMTFHLPFERFLNPYRPSAPDIDMDFADNRRADVLDYVREKYGKDKVAQICTFGTMLARGSVRDVGRALGLPYEFCDRIAKMIPPPKQGFPMSLEKALNTVPELKLTYQNEPDAKRLLDAAQKIEGSARHPSVHAAGVVISPNALTDFTPLQKETGGDNIITQYDMHAVEEAGLVKMDFLGIRNLSILGNAIKLVEKTKNIFIELTKIPFDNKKTFDLLASGRTMGMFQLGGGGMTRYLVELKPTKITDIMAMVALFRPGPMESIPEFIDRKHNPEKITYLDPRMKKFLEDSYGIITFQDDILYISIEIAGYNWEEADKLRKAMGKKIPEVMAAEKDKFIKGCIDHGKLTQEKANILWNLIEPFAAYGFGRAHAASYGIIAYQTAYMKAHYPAEFMAALMSAESDDIEKVAEAVNECKAMDIKVLPADINESFADFTVVDDNTIRFGLSAIKNIGNHIVEVIIKERKKNGKYATITDFLERVIDRDLNRKSVESFIKSGTLDSLGERHTLHANIDKLLDYARGSHEASMRNQSSLFEESQNSSGGNLTLDPVEPNKDESLAWEKKLLGLYITSHPLARHEEILKQSPNQIKNIQQTGASINIFGYISAVKEITTKKGDLMAFATLQDLTGTIEAIVFPRSYAKHKQQLVQDQIVIVSGKTESRQGNMQIICNDIELLTKESALKFQASQAQEKPKIIQSQQPYLNIYLGIRLNQESLDQIKKILYREKGDMPVVLHINGTKKLRLPIKVDTTNGLTEKIKSIVGEKNATINHV
ncbi:DNA polymerase III subunit alpha [bacterium]|nr:DNA polymerase III subunit alpha [bacterium]